MVFSKATNNYMLAITLLSLKRRFQRYIWFSDTFPFGWFQKDRQMYDFKKHDFELLYLVEVIYFCFCVVVIFLWSRPIAQLPGCGDARAVFCVYRSSISSSSSKRVQKHALAQAPSLPLKKGAAACISLFPSRPFQLHSRLPGRKYFCPPTY